ncbi:MAG: type II glyceraldehyde-3-phosphate dehydrogenase [Candidatus Altiarchaeota archaeon]|nr:type II glyceraldehyde-3-phosphate dehydrogenase [Candidatus Altiarchaeota archaeon]
MIKVGVIGYGTIGRRVADAVDLQKDMKLVGVTKNSPDYGIIIAKQKGHKLFCMDKSRFSGHETEGTIENLIDDADILIDTAPKKFGAENKEKYYDKSKKPAIYQGAEKSSIGVSFNAHTNFEMANGRNHVRVVSCNTTGLARILGLVNEHYGVAHTKVALIRRAADPKEYKKGPIDAIVPDPIGLSHHAPDLRTVLDVPINTTAYKVGSTLMHVHDVHIKTKQTIDETKLLSSINKEPRLLLADPELGFKSTAQVMDFGRDLRSRGDIFENVIFKGFTVAPNDIYLTQAIHQESIVVPDNIDAIRAIFGGDKLHSINETNRTLGIGSFSMS